MTDDELITHLAVGNFDPEPQQPNRGCLWMLAVVGILVLLYVVI